MEINLIWKPEPASETFVTFEKILWKVKCKYNIKITCLSVTFYSLLKGFSLSLRYSKLYILYIRTDLNIAFSAHFTQCFIYINYFCTFFLFNQVIMLKIREISFKFVKLISYTSTHETIRNLKQSGNYIYHLLYTKNSAFCSHGVYMCFIWFSEQNDFSKQRQQIDLWNEASACLLRGKNWVFKY